MQYRDTCIAEMEDLQYVAYRMAPTTTTLSDLEGHFYCLKPC